VLDGRIVLARSGAAEQRAAGQAVGIVLGRAFRQSDGALRQRLQTGARKIGPVRKPDPLAGNRAQPHPLGSSLLQVLHRPVAHSTGLVISPSSIRYASLISKTKLPLEMSTCPPPNCLQ